MSDSFGPRTYLVGQILPVMLTQLICPPTNSTADNLSEAVRISLYIADLTIMRMGMPIVHDFEVKP